ncbi:hypothetical protein IST453_00002 [Burkholderia multivorans]|nr:hypothetical protein IST495A_00003 [Burkholderia multivorans]CAB5278321.1 hypothetical protein IST453_00002 [Burkholderia multivorans]CAB5278427.1 hypothetical protein IST495B_00002 [Burkholderia multivorans]CAB5297459.1 hypothetical protein IST455B_02581 [Burkholderia multivorans]CAB5330685.1 hypothetical protein IST4119_00002 [Burkholderia multivorans]
MFKILDNAIVENEKYWTTQLVNTRVAPYKIHCQLINLAKVDIVVPA